MEKSTEVIGEDSLTLEQVIECSNVLGVAVMEQTPSDFKQSIEEAAKQLERMNRVN